MSPPHNDVAVLEADPVGGTTDTKYINARLWLLSPEAGEQARFGLANAMTAPPALGGVTPNAWERAVLRAVDIDGDGTDEVVMLLPDVSTTSDPSMGVSKTSLLFVGTVDTTSTSFTATQVGSLNVGLADRFVGPQNAPLCLAKIDGDAHPDLVVLEGSDPKADSSLRVFWGTGDPKHPFEDTPTVLAVTDVDKDPATVKNIQGFTCADLDLDGISDIVAVTSQWAYSTVGSAKSGARTLTLQVLEDPRNNNNTPSKDDHHHLPGGASVTIGNVDDDGVRDLVISDAKGFSLYLGKSVIP